MKELTQTGMKRIPTKNWIERECRICIKKFKVMPCVVKRGYGIYCSFKCLCHSNGKRLSKNISKENNPNWKGGISKNNYKYKLKSINKYSEKNRAREIVANAIKYGNLIRGKCKECGSNKNVEGHHKDYEKPLEVEWLCRNCHRLHHKINKN